MKAIFTILLLSVSVLGHSQTLKPYILGSTSEKPIVELEADLVTTLEQNGFTVVGNYNPIGESTRMLIVVTHPELTKAVQQVGGLTGFAITLRVAATEENGVTNLSYTNPQYWGNAYFRSDFDEVSESYAKVASSFESSFKSIGTYSGEPFGSEKGEEVDKIRKYKYMFGMPYFDETKVLGEFTNHEQAVAAVDASFETGKNGTKQVYKVSVPDQDLTLYGVALSGVKGEENFMPKIDITDPKHTAFLPYEMLVMNGEVHMLHGRFRIALSFPDLTMGTFTKIMSTPGDIQDLLEQLVQ